MRHDSRSGLGLLVLLLSGFATEALAIEIGCSEQLNFEDADIGLVIDEVARRTGKKFVVDPRVSGLVTIKAGENSGLCPEEVWEVFQAALRVNGFTATPVAGGAYKIVPAQLGAREAGSAQNAEGGYLTEIIRLDYIDAREAASSVAQIISETGVASPVPSTNAIIVVDAPRNVERVRAVLARIDRDATVVESFTLTNVSAAEAAQTIAGLTGAVSEEGQARFAALQVTPMNWSNRLVVRGRPEAVARVRDIVAEIDRAGGKEASLSVLPLNHADAATVAALLQDLAEDAASAEKPPADSAAAPRVKISAYTPTNSIIMIGDAEMQRTLKDIVARLDVRRKQVLVEAIIVEVSDATARELGLNYFVADKDGGRVLFSANTFREFERNALASAGAALLNDDPEDDEELASKALDALLAIDRFTVGGAGSFGGSRIFGAILSAVKKDERSRVLSFPSVVTIDNEPATLSVGQEIPITTGEAIGDDFSNAFRTISREEVGIILKVTPQINVGGTITLQITQESSSVAGQIISTSTDLITNKRAITTTAVVDDGDILVIGGLVDQVEEKLESKTPVLGDIPLFGNLFKESARSLDSRNLMVFIRPTIIDTKSSARQATAAKLDYIEASGGRERDRFRFREAIGAVMGGALPENGPASQGGASAPASDPGGAPVDDEPLEVETAPASLSLAPSAPAPRSPAVITPVAVSAASAPSREGGPAPPTEIAETALGAVHDDAALGEMDDFALRSVFDGDAAPVGSGALYGVHVASYRKESSAGDGWRELQRRFPSAFAGLEPRLATFVDPERGAFLRLIAGPLASEAAARELCRTLRSSAMFCAPASYEGRTLGAGEEEAHPALGADDETRSAPEDGAGAEQRGP